MGATAPFKRSLASREVDNLAPQRSDPWYLLHNLGSFPSPFLSAIFVEQGSVYRRAEAKSGPVAVESIRNGRFIVHKLSFTGTQPLPFVEYGQ